MILLTIVFSNILHENAYLKYKKKNSKIRAKIKIAAGRITSFCSLYMLLCEVNKYSLFKQCAFSQWTNQVNTKIINISMMKNTVKSILIKRIIENFLVLCRVLSIIHIIYCSICCIMYSNALYSNILLFCVLMFYVSMFYILMF